MMDEENIAAYLVYTRSGKRIILNSTPDDIYTIFVTSNPDYRRKGFATKIVNELLHGIGLDYKNSYKTIADNNIGSQKAAFANGYKVLCKAKKTKIFKTITPSENGGLTLYAISNVSNDG